MRKVMFCVGAALALSVAAQAAVMNIPLTGWAADGSYLSPGNSHASFPFPIGATIDAAEYVDLTYSSPSPSYNSELALSLNDSSGAVSFWDSGVPGAPNFPGPLGPLSGPFANPGLFNSGPFTITTGTLYVETYDTYDDAGIDQTIQTGSLNVYYSVPEPASAMLLGIGVLFGLRRRG